MSARDDATQAHEEADALWLDGRYEESREAQLRAVTLEQAADAEEAAAPAEEEAAEEDEAA